MRIAGGKVVFQGRLGAVRESVSKKTGVTNYYALILFEGGNMQIRCPKTLEAGVGKRYEFECSFDLVMCQVYAQPKFVPVPDEVIKSTELKGA